MFRTTPELRENHVEEFYNEHFDLGRPSFEKKVPPYDVDLRTATQVVDFSKRETLRGPMVANACVEVHTSDSELGTLTHLMIGVNTQKFAKDLRSLVGKAGVPTILTGGDSGVEASRLLMHGLFRDLADVGFKIVDKDLGGVCGRRSTLSRDRVELITTDSLGLKQIAPPKTLFF